MTGDELAAVAEEAARAAGDVLVARFGRERALATKSTPTDVVSEADLAAERAIREVLAARVPDDGILGEEGDDVEGTTGRRWVVDPLDGTVNFLFGLPQWCVSVACESTADGGGVLVGVVWDPVRGDLFRATAEGVATLGGEALEGSSQDELSQALVATGFGYDAAQRGRQAELVTRVIQRVRDVRRMGSAALDLAWTAAGRYDAYFEHGVKAWDTRAGELLCARAGLEVVRLDGGGVLPAGILVAPPALVAELRELVGP
ncbi:inositol monophosphatase family protein [Conexibacter sp. SYSU D00693]|uniref:inositol monophosphatase family protein n=1 Tax=Conexibacter sp. SYSU D00693 TaxID=2812560 RepID=UPI00196AB20B|nr:inositol monophosphatase family protein [Conexibacter sp. SYSU D00693]